MRFDAVVFDFDGTIAESGQGIMTSARIALERMGRTSPGDDVLRRFVGPSLFGSFRELCGLSETEAEEAVRLYRERYSAIGLFESDLYPGIVSLLEALKAHGIWTAVASGKPEAFLTRIIEHFGLTQFFDAVRGSDPANRSADKREQLRSALPEGIDMNRVCMVGDRRFDVEAGRALGAHTAGVAYGYGEPGELTRAGAEFVAETVADLKTYLLG